MRKDGYSENTAKPIGRRLRNLAKDVDPDLPEKIKGFIAKTKWSNGYTRTTQSSQSIAWRMG